MPAPRFLKAVRLASVAVAAAACASLVARPQLRDYLVAVLTDPADLPSLAEDPRVHFQAGARACAQEVAAMLPDAMARVEATQGRRFPGSPIVGVYASFEDYARANGLGDARVAAVSRSGRVILSPTLCGEERDRLPGVLTHELSHAHFFGWRARAGLAAPVPSWFSEGLAVMVSDGGAAEGVDAEAAAEAARQGYAIVVDDKGSWIRFTDIRFERELPSEGSADALSTRRQRLAFREAADYVAWLRASDEEAFGALLARLEDGASFGATLRELYGFDSARGWRLRRAALSQPSDSRRSDP